MSIKEYLIDEDGRKFERTYTYQPNGWTRIVDIYEDGTYVESYEWRGEDNDNTRN